ncbi:MAG: T9SS type A sorting domain-containing protein [Bacteroidia bacterium]
MEIKKSLACIIFIFLSLETFSKIKFVINQTYISQTTQVNVDIDQDGLWDAKLSGKSGGPHYIEPAYRDSSNFTLVNIISDQEQNPTPFPYGANMQTVGKWINITNSGERLVIKDYMDQGTKYIGIILVKKGIQFCGWIQIFNWGKGTLGLGTFAWDDENKSKCMSAGYTEYTSVPNIPVIDNLTIHPSPANNFIAIKGINSEVDVYVYNSLGEKVISYNKVSSNDQLDIRDLQGGIYFILFIENGICIRKKFMISR